MNFVMGLVLTLTDNASSGIKNAVNSINNLTESVENAGNSLEYLELSTFSDDAIRIGRSFMNAGSSIISSLSGVISSVNETGQTLMFAENQLDSLYAKSGKTGKEVIGQIQEYAKTSMFEFENLIPAVTQLKSVGIEAFDSITSSTGNAQYSLLDYASALASFAPQMRNAYGTGINAAIGAMREYIAEGNAMSLKRGAGLDITGILGEDKGATIEERTKQVADLIETLNMMPMVDAMSNSPMTKLSNMGDTLFQLKGMIADSGVYEAYSRLIDVFANFVGSLNDSRLQSLASSIGSALTMLMKPVELLSKVLVTLVNGFLKLVETFPIITKIVAIATALAGVILVVSGASLIFLGSITLLKIAMQGFTKSLSKVGISLGGFKAKVLGSLLPLTATIGLMYLAWKADLLGIRTNVTNFTNSVANSFRTARNAVSGDVAGLTSTLADLRNRDDFFSGLTIALMRVMVLGKALSEAWDDYTLSEDTYLKAKELGLLPLIEAILDLKYRFDHFKEGFKQGWNEIHTFVTGAVNKIKTSVKGTIFESMFDSITGFFQALSNNDPKTWQDLGDSMGKFAYVALTVGVAYKVISSVVGKISSIISGCINAVSRFVGIIGKIIGGISKVFGVLKTFFTSVAGGVTMLISGIILAVTNFVDMFRNGFNKVKEILMLVGIALAAVGAIILGAPVLIAGIVAGIIAIVANLVIAIKQHWDEIKTGISNVLSTIKTTATNVWSSITSTISSIIGKIKSTVTSGFNAVKSTVSTISSGIKSAVSGAFNSIVSSVSSAISKAKSTVSSGLNAIKGFFSNLKLKLPHIKLPHFSISGNLSIKPPSVPKLSVQWYEKGGVFDSPSVIGVGENGQEAVMPLENNTGWITQLAGMITASMRSNEIVPSNTQSVSGSQSGVGGNEYLTNSSSTTNNISGDTDNSVVFNEGAIQVNVQSATDDEAMRLAKKIMEFIKRQKELDKMLSYA